MLDDSLRSQGPHNEIVVSRPDLKRKLKEFYIDFYKNGHVIGSTFEKKKRLCQY